MKYPKEAQVFRSGPNLTCAGKHIEATLNEWPGSLLVRCGCISGREWYPASVSDLIPLTETARSMLAIARGSR